MSITKALVTFSIMLAATYSSFASEIVNEDVIKLNNEFNNAMEEGNLSSMLKLYSDDVVWMQPKQPISQGISTSSKNFSFVIKNKGSLKHKLKKIELSKDGSQAIAIGSYELDIESLKMTDKGKFLLVLEKRAGSLKIITDIFNSNR